MQEWQEENKRVPFSGVDRVKRERIWTSAFRYPTLRVEQGVRCCTCRKEV